MRGDIERDLAACLDEIDAQGALCALNIDGAISTYSAGEISAHEHGASFYIYSISKTITAVAVMLLTERGVLDLDEDLSCWESGYSLPTGVTVRQLLNHTGGLSDYFSSKAYQQAVHSRPETPWSYQKLMEVGLNGTPLFAPGEGWSYSNPGYAILKELIEERSGYDYYKFIEAHILLPLDLSETKPFDRLDHGVSLLAGVDSSMNVDFRDVYHPGWIATGSFISTVSDISIFYQGLFSGKLVSAASLEEMKSTVLVPFAAQAAREPRYGLGLMSFGNDPHGENYGHGGGGPGYSTYAKHLPNYDNQQITVMSVVNASLPQTPFQMADCVLDCVLGKEGITSGGYVS